MNPVQTIRENAERLSRNSTDDPRGCGDAILAALAELEKQHQEPVAGFKLVPLTPDREVREALEGKSGVDFLLAYAVWRRPTTAAPAAQQPQAEAVPQWVSCRCFDEVSKRLCADQNRCSQVVAASAAPQQAEVVPSDVVRDAEAYHWLATALTSPDPYDVLELAFGHLQKDQRPTKAEFDAAIYAALEAAPKGQP